MTRSEQLLVLVAVSAMSLVSGCGQAFPCGELADMGPALADVCSDGVLTCDEDCSRSRYNVCPAIMPVLGLDEQGVWWVPDLFFGGPNPYHPDADCWRGSTRELGSSSYQCCYQEGLLVTEGLNAGTFDFMDPFQSPQALLHHVLLDIVPYGACECQ